MTRYLTALVLALLAATAVSVPAQAHAELKSSNPATGATLDTPLKHVELVFSEAIQLPDGAAVTVTGADGATLPVTQVHALDNTITATVDAAAAKSGAHTIAWAAKSDDGDTITGTIAFSMTVVAQSTPASAPPPSVSSAPVSNAPPSTAPEESGGVPIWVWIVIGLAVVVGAILLVGRRNRTESL